MRYTEEKLNTFSKETLIQLFLAQQEQLSEIDKKLQLVLEQLAVMNQNRYGRKTDTHTNTGTLLETQGELLPKKAGRVSIIHYMLFY